MGKKVVIVGGVAGGAGVAARLRRLDENIEIVMLERGDYISFANCGLPYYISGVIAEREKLLVQTEEMMEARFAIDIRVNSEVTKIFRKEKEVEVVSEGRSYRESYDYLVLSPGAAPIIPPTPGINQDGIFTLRNMADVDQIKNHLTTRKPKTALVIGGGYIGVEMAENLKHAGLDVTLVEAAEQILGPLDQEMAKMIENVLVNKGIKLILGNKVTKFSTEYPMTITLSGGGKFTSELVILAIGVKPEVKLAVDAGLTLGSSGGIAVDDSLRTSDPAIFAAGDAIEVKQLVNGQPVLIPLAGPANKQARIVADNITGRPSIYKGSQGTSILKAFHMTAAATGMNEKSLLKMAIPFQKSYTHSGSHAGYYPGAMNMTVKILFDPQSGRILGAQIVGVDGVDKRIDIFATAIRQEMTVFDLEELELAYAPPFSSAKDPVNMAGFTAANIIKGDMPIFHWDQLLKSNPEDYFVLDASTKVEFENSHFYSAVNIPLDNLRQRLHEIPRDRKTLVYCKIGLRGYLACRILMQSGFDVYNLSGGYDLYRLYKDQVGKGFELDELQTKIEQKNIPVDLSGSKTIVVDACGLQCPGPIMRTNKEMALLLPGEVMEVHATDSAFGVDAQAWCSRTGNQFLKVEDGDNGCVVWMMKGKPENSVESLVGKMELPQGKCMVVFSGDLDKALAAFIIANGGAAMGRPVTLFFTFWGLNILRKNTKVAVKKNLIEKMFAWMMPRGPQHLTLSQMSMGGIGGMMIKSIMRKKNVSSLEESIQQAIAQGVRLVACNMSMDLMGIKKEELIDGVEIGGVAAYLAAAEESNVNLFI